MKPTDITRRNDLDILKQKKKASEKITMKVSF